MSYEAAKSAVVLAGLVAAGGIFGLTAYRLLWVNLRAGRPSGPLGGWWRRFLGLMTYVGGQRRLFRLPVPGIAHFLIFWGFVLLALSGRNPSPFMAGLSQNEVREEIITAWRHAFHA